MFTFPDGRKFIGEFVNGSIEGKGVFEFPDGRIYSGNFLNGLPHHSGVLKFSDGRYYKENLNRAKGTARGYGSIQTVDAIKVSSIMMSNMGGEN